MGLFGENYKTLQHHQTLSKSAKISFTLSIKMILLWMEKTKNLLGMSCVYLSVCIVYYLVSLLHICYNLR